MLGGNIGLRLKAMEYWRCAETGLLSASGASMEDASLKLVIAEPLPDVSELLLPPSVGLFRRQGRAKLLTDGDGNL